MNNFLFAGFIICLLSNLAIFIIILKILDKIGDEKWK